MRQKKARLKISLTKQSLLKLSYIYLRGIGQIKYMQKTETGLYQSPHPHLCRYTTVGSTFGDGYKTKA